MLAANCPCTPHATGNQAAQRDPCPGAHRCGLPPRGDDGGLGPRHQATRFASLEAAAARLATLAARADSFRIEFVTRARRTKTDASDDTLFERLVAIPHPFRRTAYNRMRGKDVATVLRQQGENVYRRHHRLLLTHGFDIAQRSPVALLTPRRRRLDLNIGGPSGDGQPTQLVPLPRQRSGGDEV